MAAAVMSVMYVLTTPIPEDSENATMDQIRRRNKLNIVNDNIASAFMLTSKLSIIWHAKLGHVHFKRMQDMSKDGLIPAFDMDTVKCKSCMLTKITKKPFQNVKHETKVLELIHNDLCDPHATPSLGNKKYFVTFIDDASRFCYVYLLHTKDEALDKFKVFKTEVELQQGSLIKRFKTDRGGEYMNTLYFQSVGIIHEMTASYTLQQNDISEMKNRVLKEMVNFMLSYSGLSQGFWGEAMLTACYLLNRVPNKRNKITPYEIYIKRKTNLNYLRVWGCRAVVRLTELKLKTLSERGIQYIFVGYAEHSKAFRCFVIKHNESVLINSIIKLRDVIFDENRFFSVPRPSLSILKGTEDIGGSVVPKEVTDEVVQQPESELRKSKRNRTPKDFGPEFQLYLIEETMDEVSNQHSYCFNVEDDLKTFDETMKSQDVAFRKEVINDEMDSILGNNTWVLVDLPPVQVDLTKEFLSSMFSMKDMGEADVIMVSTPMDTSEKLMPNNGQAVSQLEYSMVIGCLLYAMTCRRPDIAFVVGKLSSNTEDNSSTSGWVFLLGGGVISWASKKQTCITGSTMKSEFVALVAAGKEAEWLRSLILEIPLWSKPIASSSIRCDSAATLANAYSQIYNGKSRHL
ncbi:zinc finger, CCHC-type containing protein, partial [Tanacetum coccineum]